MVPIRPFRLQLFQDIAEIESEIGKLQSCTTISEFRNDPNSMVFVVAPPYHWDPLPLSERRFQAEILGRYTQWSELLFRCYASHSGDLRQELAEVDKYFREAIELNGGWNVSGTHQENREALTKKLTLYRSLLNTPHNSSGRVVVVPDTNALLAVADPTAYRDVSGCDQFDFVLIPTVLSELDQIKMSRRDKDLGERAQKVIQRLKGYRAQGSVRDGVTVDRTITVRMIPTEPRMAQLPSWLDPQRADDRILGSALEIQFSDLSAAVLLVTNDLNLQNKAEMAFLPWAEPPASQIIGAGGTP